MPRLQNRNVRDFGRLSFLDRAQDHALGVHLALHAVLIPAFLTRMGERPIVTPSRCGVDNCAVGVDTSCMGQGELAWRDGGGEERIGEREDRERREIVRI